MDAGNKNCPNQCVIPTLTNFKLSLQCMSFDLIFLWHLQDYWYVTGRLFLMSKEKLEENMQIFNPCHVTREVSTHLYLP